MKGSRFMMFGVMMAHQIMADFHASKAYLSLVKIDYLSRRDLVR